MKGVKLVNTIKKMYTFLHLACVVGISLLITGCPNPQQEQSLTQIQSQMSVLSNEVRDSFRQSEEARIESYQKLAEDIRLLQQNQADASATNDQLITALNAIEAKLDEYNDRMAKLSERLDSTETALTERITSLSEQVNDMGRETTITPGTPTQRPTTPPPTGVSDPSLPPTTESPVQAPVDSEESQFYHSVYTAYVNGDFERAIGGFQKFLDTYPQSELADISQFWIAESFFSLGEYETANQEYDRLLQKYPNSDKVPAALFGKADAYLKLERQIEAISHLRYIVNQFPNSPIAQKAAERLRALGE
ncbi:putative aspartyl/asparaginyl beta-hydroxylase [Candidatus Vecturithrix granuli]|uniref:Putative aspartyl/asparaginyl beta-hydroxylase n=1 Tax=Vecturithrix granuli TaxID=1499967 RepID=A0A081BUI3_VECG1|nr:putative aspartyl/asparaginyl beta-hydroxylase [Candidatus Vecturithrix granuli]